MTDRRAELLDGATAWVIEHGLSTLSLRPVAKALGTSDRMLIYWFGSRDGLLAAIAEHAGEGLSLALPVVDPATADTPGLARPVLGALHRSARAAGVGAPLRARCPRRPRPGPARDAARRTADRWVEVVDGALAVVGVPETGRRPLSRVVAGAMVGLILDELVGDPGPRPEAELALLATLIEDATARS